MGSHHVGMVGIGYAGLPLAVELAKAGNDVVGFDIDPSRVEAVNDGRSPVDTVTDAEIRTLRDRLRASTDPSALSACSIIVVCAPTPVDGDKPDLRPLTSAVETVASRLRAGQLVIVESTTHPGTTDGLLQPILERSGLLAGVDFHLAYSPERIDPGNTRFRIGNTPRVVGGLTPACAERAAEFYRQVTSVHVTRGMREAEAAKILENTYRQVNIALVNEFSQLCHGMGIDVWDTVAAASTKPYGFSAFWPGAGVGGHCIPADPLYLIHHAGTLGMAFKVAETAHRINEGMPAWVAGRIAKDLEEHSGPIGGATVLLLGVTYKPNTDDVRHTPAIPIAEALLERGAKVVCHDPYVDGLSWPGGRIDNVPDLAEAVREADLVVLLQRHDLFDLDLITQARRLFDATGSVRAEHSVLL